MIESCVTFFPVQDIEATARFYARVIGLKLWQDMGKCRIFDCGRGFWGFCQYDDGRKPALGTCLSLNMPDTEAVDRQYARLKAMGVCIKQPPARHSEFPVYSFFMSDPDGYTVEFQKIMLPAEA